MLNKVDLLYRRKSKIWVFRFNRNLIKSKTKKMKENYQKQQKKSEDQHSRRSNTQSGGPPLATVGGGATCQLSKIQWRGGRSFLYFRTRGTGFFNKNEKLSRASGRRHYRRRGVHPGSQGRGQTHLYLWTAEKITWSPDGSTPRLFSKRPFNLFLTKKKKNRIPGKKCQIFSSSPRRQIQNFGQTKVQTPPSWQLEEGHSMEVRPVMSLYEFNWTGTVYKCGTKTGILPGVYWVGFFIQLTVK